MSQKNYGVVASVEELAKHIERIGDDVFAFDIETGYHGEPKEKHALKPEIAFIVGISFTNSTEWARYAPLAHDSGGNLDNHAVAELLWPWLRQGKGIPHNCFTGDTEFITSEGLRRFDQVVGREVEVWTERGWVKAPVRSYGQAAVRTVTLVPYNRSRSTVQHEIQATSNHRWEVERQRWGNQRHGEPNKVWEPIGLVTTEALRSGDRIRAEVPRLQPDTYSDGFRHGLIFADGALTSTQPKGQPYYVHQLRLCGRKEQYKDRFDNYTYPPSANGDPVVNSYRAPVNLKELPPEDASPQYLRDFIAGWSEFDGAPHRTDSFARIALTTKIEEAEWLRRNAAVAGYLVTGHNTVHPTIRANGEPRRLHSLGHYVRRGGGIATIYNTTLSRDPNMAWTVKEVSPSHGSHEVFCVEVPEVERFSLGPGIYTGNSKFELRHMARFFRKHLSDHSVYGAEVREADGYFEVFSDTQAEAYALAETKNFGLKFLTEEIFQHKMTELWELFPDLPKNKRKTLRFNVLDLSPKNVDYACEDSLWTLALHRRNYPRVMRERKFIYMLEMAVIPVVCEMEDFGVEYDWDFLREASTDAKAFTDPFNQEIQAELSALVGEPVKVNMASPKQISDILFGKLGMKVNIYTAKTKNLPMSERQMSTSKLALKALAKRSPVVKKILQWKELKKLIGSYLDKYEREFNYATDGRAHPDHMQMFVTTGRFSVGDPAYQGSPKKYHYELSTGEVFDLKFRDCVYSPKDHYILGFDYSQVELRGLAGLAQEPALIEAFATGVDVHKKTASLMLNKPVDLIDDDDRQIGKAQPSNSPVLTPTGWRLLGELQPGDFVIGSDGQPTKVTGTYPQGLREVFEVRFADGSCAQSCNEHYWAVGSRRAHSETLQLKDIKENLRIPRNDDKNEWRYWVYPVHPVEMDEPELPFDPYALGLLLGDGSFRGTGPSYSSVDAELLRSLSQALSPLGLHLRHKSAADYYIVGHGRQGTGSRGPLTQILQNLGLWKTSSHTKFIPPEFKFSSANTRHALLQGLLDTDGSATTTAVEYVTVSEQLAQDVMFLVRSLGGLAKAKISRKTYTYKGEKKVGRPAWRIYIRLGTLQPFRLARKANAYTPSQRTLKNEIVGVESVGTQETLCISVANADGLYATQDCVLTHNTLNFGIDFGMQAKSLAERLGITVPEGEELLAKYYAAYKQITKWSKAQVEFGKEHGYVETFFGRRVPIWEFGARENYVRLKGERACVAYAVQGSATGDLPKIAMVRARKALRQAGIADRVHMVMNIHDALNFYVHRSLEPQEVIDVLEPAISFPVPGWPEIEAEWYIGRRWGSVRALEKDADGQWVIKEVKEFETGEEPDILNDDEDEEEEGFEDDGVEEESEPLKSKTVIVEITAMPDAVSYQRFISLLDSMPGVNVVELRTPEGTVTLSKHPTGVDPQDQARISMVLGGARVLYRAEDVDPASILEGVKL